MGSHVVILQCSNSSFHLNRIKTMKRKAAEVFLAARYSTSTGTAWASPTGCDAWRHQHSESCKADAPAGLGHLLPGQSSWQGNPAPLGQCSAKRLRAAGHDCSEPQLVQYSSSAARTSQYSHAVPATVTACPSVACGSSTWCNFDVSAPSPCSVYIRAYGGSLTRPLMAQVRVHHVNWASVLDEEPTSLTHMHLSRVRPCNVVGGPRWACQQGHPP